MIEPVNLNFDKNEIDESFGFVTKNDKLIYTIDYELKRNRELNKPKIIKSRIYKPDYLDYLQSDEWKKKRNQAVEIYKSCVLCNSKQDLNVHHRTYKNIGNENIYEDLTVLCRRCHTKYHSWTGTIKTIVEKRRKRKRRNKWR